MLTHKTRDASGFSFLSPTFEARLVDENELLQDFAHNEARFSDVILQAGPQLHRRGGGQQANIGACVEEGQVGSAH